MDEKPLKEAVRREWTGAAAARRRWAPKIALWTRAATEAMVQVAQISPGMRVLDVASGAGEPALTLAAAVGPQGRVTASDLVSEMLAIAEESAGTQGLSNMAFLQADAEALPFPDQHFDRVTCRFGVMFFTNAGQALREIHRVLKPGGRAVFMAWGPWERSPQFTTTLGVFLKHAPTPPEAGTFAPFKFREAGKLAAALEAAGFQQVQEESRTFPWAWPGPAEEFWECFQLAAAPFRRLFDSIAPEKREQVWAEVLAAMRPYEDRQQVNFEALIVLAWGVRES